jgi:Mg2+ and Co2+ transporter CorA
MTLRGFLLLEVTSGFRTMRTESLPRYERNVTNVQRPSTIVRLFKKNILRIITMNPKNVLTGFLTIAPIVFIVSLVVSYLYGMLVHGSGAVDWEASVRLAIIFGIVLPIVHGVDKKKTS